MTPGQGINELRVLEEVTVLTAGLNERRLSRTGISLATDGADVAAGAAG
ncbi:hypothetical protein ACX80U_11285 [Arthrobacter sp. TmT3-37]